MRLSRRRIGILSTFVLAALLGSCFEPPVAERMLLEFLSDGAARATLMIDLGRAEDFESPAVRKRIATAERGLTEGTDPWLARFERLTQGTDGTSFQRARGALREFRRWAELNDPAAFSQLFGDDPVDFSYSRDGDRAALEIFLETQMGAPKLIEAKAQFNSVGCAGWMSGPCSGEMGCNTMYCAITTPPRPRSSGSCSSSTARRWSRWRSWCRVAHQARLRHDGARAPGAG